MTDDDPDDYVRTSHRIPTEIRNAAQAATQHGELSEAVRQLYRAVAHGESPADAARFAAEQVRVEREIEYAQQQMADAEERLDDLRERRETLDTLREAGNDRQADYEAALAQLEQDMRDGMAVYPEHGAVQQAASTVGVGAEDVIEDLQDRNPELPDRAFRNQRDVEFEWRGVNGGR